MTRQYSICCGKEINRIGVDDLASVVYYIIIIITACSFAAVSSCMIMHNISITLLCYSLIDFKILLETCTYHTDPLHWPENVILGSRLQRYHFTRTDDE